MPRKPPPPLEVQQERFLRRCRPGQVMFCKRYRVKDMWEIDRGAVLDLTRDPQPRLVQLCQALYSEDDAFFIGDTAALMAARTDLQSHHGQELREAVIY